MHPFSLILGMEINLVEIVIFQVGAVIFGFAIHFFISSRKNFQLKQEVPDTFITEDDQNRLRFYEELEVLENENEKLKRDLQEAGQIEERMERELTSLREELLQQEEEKAQKPEVLDNAQYIEHLEQAQHNLIEHNQQINLLLDQIKVLKDAEQKHLDILKDNEQLNQQLRDLRKELSEKEAQVKLIRQQQTLTRELQERLEKTYTDFNSLQDKIQKVESYVLQPQHSHFEFEELQESFFKLSRDFDELKLKYLNTIEENQRLTRLLSDSEDKLQEANFQRQQLLKKVSYLEDLNKDLQQLAEQNKKMENQLRRMNEIESFLARVTGSSDPQQQPHP
ncbi:MAG: hypothetical protein RJA57_610 [Bacteroidota bacterium]|jgi:chromosome segregation ATPase